MHLSISPQITLSFPFTRTRTQRTRPCICYKLTHMRCTSYKLTHPHPHPQPNQHMPKHPHTHACHTCTADIQTAGKQHRKTQAHAHARPARKSITEAVPKNTRQRLDDSRDCIKAVSRLICPKKDGRRQSEIVVLLKHCGACVSSQRVFVCVVNMCWQW